MQYIYFTVEFGPSIFNHDPFNRKIVALCSELDVAMIGLHMQQPSKTSKEGNKPIFILYRSEQHSNNASIEDIGPYGVPIEYKGIVPIAVKAKDKSIYLDTENDARFRKIIGETMQKPSAVKDRERQLWRQVLIPNDTLKVLLKLHTLSSNGKEIKNKPGNSLKH